MPNDNAWDTYKKAVQDNPTKDDSVKKALPEYRTIKVGDKEILIEMTKVLSFTRYHSNRYRVGDEWVDRGSLTAEEAGHSYTITRAGSDRVMITNDNRLWDAEADVAIRGLRSVVNLDPYIMSQERLRDTPSANSGPALNHEFSLSTSDYKVFVERAVRLGWLIIEKRPTIDKLVQHVGTVCKMVPYLSESLKAVSDLSSKLLKGLPRARDSADALQRWTDDMTNCYRRVVEAEDELGAIQDAIKAAEDQLQGLEDDEIHDSEIGVQELLLEKWRPVYRECRLEVERLEKVISSAVRNPNDVIRPVQSLRDELRRLVQYFPIVKEHVYADGSKDDHRLVIKVLGSEIVMSKDKVQIDKPTAELTRMVHGETIDISRPEEEGTAKRRKGRFRRWKNRHL